MISPVAWESALVPLLHSTDSQEVGSKAGEVGLVQGVIGHATHRNVALLARLRHGLKFMNRK